MSNTNWRQIKWHIFKRREGGKEEQEVENVKLESKYVGSVYGKLEILGDIYDHHTLYICVKFSKNKI